jgi:hypothetical protein
MTLEDKSVRPYGWVHKLYETAFDDDNPNVACIHVMRHKSERFNTPINILETEDLAEVIEVLQKAIHYTCVPEHIQDSDYAGFGDEIRSLLSRLVGSEVKRREGE